MKSKNIKAFKALILKYEAITEKDILDANFPEHTFNAYKTAKNLTGFGTQESCTLHDTYNAIEKAKTAINLLIAFKTRAFYMRSFLKELKIKQP